jgi:hypothetical protein
MFPRLVSLEHLAVKCNQVVPEVGRVRGFG